MDEGHTWYDVVNIMPKGSRVIEAERNTPIEDRGEAMDTWVVWRSHKRYDVLNIMLRASCVFKDVRAKNFPRTDFFLKL